MVPIYVSEGMVDLYGFAPGKSVRLPIATTPFQVAGVYRDYARQHGSITIARGAYRASAELAVTPGAVVFQNDLFHHVGLSRPAC
jgi:hypothetical protein